MTLTTTNLSLFETTKSERQTFAQSVIEGLMEGNFDPLKVHLQVKCMEDLIKQITSNDVYKDLLVTEASKYGKAFEHYNSKFEIKEMGVKYDFENCGDPVLQSLEQQLESIQNEVKERQKFLRTIPESGMEILVDDELIKVYPPTKTSTTTVTINLK